MSKSQGSRLERLLLVRCPTLLQEDEGGLVMRNFAAILACLSRYSPWVQAVRPGICTIPARGPARYFGGEEALVDLLRKALQSTPETSDNFEIGIADGLFCALLAAQVDTIVEAGSTASFLAPWPVAILDRPEMTDLLARLGILTLGQFASLPKQHVLGRFGSDAAACHRIAQGVEGELPGVRHTGIERKARSTGAATVSTWRQGGFWGGSQEAVERASRAFSAVQQMIGAESVLVARLQGGRNPAEEARLVTWEPDSSPSRPDGATAPPWPGRIPSPAPCIVYQRSQPIEILGRSGDPITVTGRGAISAEPTSISIDRGAFTAISSWAGPWPTQERWWSRNRRRSARIQLVTAEGLAHLIAAENSTWWLEATYD